MELGRRPSSSPVADRAMRRRVLRMAEPLGVVAAGHPLSAQAGADALRAGGNAVDAALAAMLASFACEPLLTGLGAGGYMLVVEPGTRRVLLDFFVEAPGRGADAGRRAPSWSRSASRSATRSRCSTSAPASVGTYGMPAGVCEAASTRFGRLPLAELVAPAARLARDGRGAERPAGVRDRDPGRDRHLDARSARRCSPPTAGLLRAGDVVRQPELADALERLGAEGPAPFYTGDIAAAIVDWLAARGGVVTAEDLAAYAVVDREPVRAAYRGREVLTNPPPSAGGILIAHALALLDAQPGPPELEARRRGDGADPGRAHARVPRGARRPGVRAGGSWTRRSPLGSTTHIAVLDREGWACSVTCSNGSSLRRGRARDRRSPEQHARRAGPQPARLPPPPAGPPMPSMMAPTVVLRDGAPELVLGSAGFEPHPLGDPADDHPRGRRRPARPATRCGRRGSTSRTASSTPSRGSTPGRSSAQGRAVARFRELNLFFGGVQAAARDAQGRFSGGGDPRRGGRRDRRGRRSDRYGLRALVRGRSRRRPLPSPGADSTSSRRICSCSARSGAGAEADAAGQRRRHDLAATAESPKSASRPAAAPAPATWPTSLNKDAKAQAQASGDPAHRVHLHGQSARTARSRFRTPPLGTHKELAQLELFVVQAGATSVRIRLLEDALSLTVLVRTLATVLARLLITQPSPQPHHVTFQAIVLGVLQGVTELFPISSLGHTVIFPNLFGWNNIVAWQSQPESPWLAFVVMLHVGSAVGLLIYFWRTGSRSSSRSSARLRKRTDRDADRAAGLADHRRHDPGGDPRAAARAPVRVALAKPLAAPRSSCRQRSASCSAPSGFRRRAEVRALAAREGAKRDGGRRLDTLDYRRRA